MHANYAAATRAFPAQTFILHKPPYAETRDIGKIFNHAHCVLGPVPLIKTFKVFARHHGAGSTIFITVLAQNIAVPDLALFARFRFFCIHCPAAGAMVVCAKICLAYPAIHPARGDERGFYPRFYIHD